MTESSGQPNIREVPENQGKNVGAVVDISKKEKSTKRVVKPKIESIGATHIVDAWRLVRESQLESRQPYPDITEDSPETMQSWLFEYMRDPMFTGLIARVGRKPVGIILGKIAHRQFGSPRRFAFIWCFWVSPEARKSGVGNLIWNDYTSKLKHAGIFHWEAHCHEELLQYLKRETGVPVKTLMSTVGGRI